MSDIAAAGSGPRVVIGATSAATLAGLRLALSAGGVAVLGNARSVDELISLVRECDPDLCLVDVDIGGGGGIRAVAGLAVAAPEVPVVVLGVENDEEQFLDAMRVGAAGYVPRTIAPARLPNALQAVLNGEPAVPRALVVALINEYRARPGRRRINGAQAAADLTSREWEVLDLMRQGLSTRQIGQRLLISDVTVRRHVGSVLKKLRVQSRSEALKLLQSA